MVNPDPSLNFNAAYWELRLAHGCRPCSAALHRKRTPYTSVQGEYPLALASNFPPGPNPLANLSSQEMPFQLLLLLAHR
jgi:hypothetical protein